jgi:hypothetical protein
MRFLAMLALSVSVGCGAAEAATFGPPPVEPEPALELGLPAEPAALGSPCRSTTPMAFTVDLLSAGPFGYAPLTPQGTDNSLLGLFCRITAVPIGQN